MWAPRTTGIDDGHRLSAAMRRINADAKALSLPDQNRIRTRAVKAWLWPSAPDSWAR